ncbi:hypothetical protein DY262_11010 [Hydrogenophaga borbori]|uniref:O-antigen ligase-related domain-containing protein n=1 Tax=Hydrogenophaga borbori TaxID=2294117 RepID=A0A372EIZ3_9BURK|nr:lysylphosphatidylglycerol synthase domain-containing protein [Hydrogenophaga borbori]RFP78624.1 hypothetical protein DY262_11010 [Hydrogenophaga borbori]
MLSSTVRRSATAVAGLSLFGVALFLASPQGLLAQLHQLSLTTAFWVTLLAISNLAVVAFRFWRVLRHCNIPLSWETAWRACLSGNLASLAFIPLLAQVAGRQAILHRMGVSPVTTASVSALERVLLAGTSAMAACAGAGYLMGQEALQRFVAQLALPQLSLVVGVAALVVFGFTRSAFESRLIRRSLSRRVFSASLETLGITVIGHALIVAAFVVAFSAVGVDLSPMQLLAAAAIVSFAASLPLSVGGWGVRELASVMVLGGLGVDAATAMAGSVAVGLCSTLAILLTSTGLLKRPLRSSPSITAKPLRMDRHDLENTASWLLGMTTVALVFFQVHLDLGGHVVNVNVGDPFAMLALSAVGLWLVSQRTLPSWTLAGFNTWLLCFSAALLLAFAVGAARMGITPWALGNKLTGWLVLLGYLSAGYLLARDHGRVGVLRMIEVALVVICTIVWAKVIIRATPWFPGQLAAEPINFEGFSGNRNALAFQLCAVLAVTLGHLRILSRRLIERPWLHAALLGGLSTVLLGIVLTGSRTGMGVAAALLLAAFFSQPTMRKIILTSVLGACIAWLVVTQLASAIHWVFSSLGAGEAAGSVGSVGSGFSEDTSDGLRWRANHAALEMWWQSPWLGAGLGSFIHGSEARFGETLTIHSTPLWILAEFGLVGVAVMAFAVFIVCRHLWRHRPLDARNLSAALLLIGFALFSQLHEMLYQRTLWLFLGALLAAQIHRRPSE